jgi:hypothetical protein
MNRAGRRFGTLRKNGLSIYRITMDQKYDVADYVNENSEIIDEFIQPNDIEKHILCRRRSTT